MSDDIKVGDRFLVEVEVRSGGTPPYVICLPAGAHGSDTFAIHREIIFDSKRLPRPLKVGDMVERRLSGWITRGKIVAVKGEWAWVDTGGSGGLFPLDALNLAEESAP